MTEINLRRHRGSGVSRAVRPLPLLPQTIEKEDVHRAMTHLSTLVPSCTHDRGALVGTTTVWNAKQWEKGFHHANREGLPGGGERDPSDPVPKPFLERPPLPSFTFPKDAKT